MEREIKFRIWDKKYNCFVDLDNPKFGALLYDNTIAISTGYDAENNPTWDWSNMELDRYLHSQYTGLKDKNDKEIYEGDVLSIDKIASLYKNCPITVIGSVFFGLGKYDVNIIKCINRNFNSPSTIHFGLRVSDWIHLPELNKCEIIGNIYENEYLLNNK